MKQRQCNTWAIAHKKMQTRAFENSKLRVSHARNRSNKQNFALSARIFRRESDGDEKDSYRGLDVPRGPASSRPLGERPIEGVGVVGKATNYHSH